MRHDEAMMTLDVDDGVDEDANGWYQHARVVTISLVRIVVSSLPRLSNLVSR